MLDRRLLRNILLATLGLIAVGTSTFMSTAGLSFSESLYETVLILLSHFDHYGFKDPQSRWMVIFLVLSSFVVVAFYSVTALVVSTSTNLIPDLVLNIVYLTIGNSVLCFASYTIEISRRRAFVIERQMEEERRALKSERQELRSQVFDLVMEKFGVTHVQGKGVDLSSPAEKVLKLLQDAGKRSEW